MSRLFGSSVDCNKFGLGQINTYIHSADIVILCLLSNTFIVPMSLLKLKSLSAQWQVCCHILDFKPCRKAMFGSSYRSASLR